MIIFKLFYFYLPVALANMAPVLFKNYFLFLNKPIDDKLFGSHKTYRGIILATLSGGILYNLQYLLAQQFESFNYLPFDYLSAPWFFGYLFSLSAILGDLLKSFIKRRFNIKPGELWFPFDQIDFILTSTLLATLFFPITIWHSFYVLFFGIFLHILINRIGYLLKLKKTPW